MAEEVGRALASIRIVGIRRGQKLLDGRRHGSNTLVYEGGDEFGACLAAQSCI